MAAQSPGGENPYRYTAFAVLGLDPAVRGGRAIATHARKRLQRVRFGVQTLFGRSLSEAEVHDAEQCLRDPVRRLSEELRTHRPHPARVRVDDLTARLAQLRTPSPSVGPPRILLDRDALLELVPPPGPRTFPPLPTDAPDAI
ncbi:MAG: hypothetical protein ACRDSP_12935 [Pseudonocardiaceae bacterium]